MILLIISINASIIHARPHEVSAMELEMEYNATDQECWVQYSRGFGNQFSAVVCDFNTEGPFLNCQVFNDLTDTHLLNRCTPEQQD